jgi:hypothetical protein
MKRFYTLLLTFSFIALGMSAQTLWVKRGAVSIAYDMATLGEVQVAEGGKQLTVQGATYAVETIDQMQITEKTVAQNTVHVNYAESGATVELPGTLAPYVNISVDGADVSIVADAAYEEEVIYCLGGVSENGSFTMEGEFKATVVLNELTLTTQKLNMPAINVLNGKRINIEVYGENNITDTTAGTHKGAFFVNGHAEFKGSGVLNITGKSKHAYVSDEYTQFESDFTGQVNVLAAEGDAFHIDQYLLMQGGTLTMKQVKGDGIDVSFTNDATDEDNGKVFIEGGTIILDVAADDTKGIKSDDSMIISGGTIKGTVSGNGTKGLSVDGDLNINQKTGTTLIDLVVTGTTYAPGTAEESKCRGIKGKADFTFDGGKILISATGAKSKAISIDGNYYYISGSLNCAVDAAN